MTARKGDQRVLNALAPSGLIVPQAALNDGCVGLRTAPLERRRIAACAVRNANVEILQATSTENASVCTKRLVVALSRCYTDIHFGGTVANQHERF